MKIKPLSVNKCWQGRRYKTGHYKQYEKDLLLILPRLTVPDKKPLRIEIRAGISKTSDIDNVAKPFLDVLQKKYGFNDRYIYELVLKKFEVKKGEEYIDFDITVL